MSRSYTHPIPGDVTLSAEDMDSRNSMHHPPSSQHGHAPPIPVDFEAENPDDGAEGDYYVNEEEEEDHYYWHIPTAAKFLLAGGVAGAG